MATNGELFGVPEISSPEVLAEKTAAVQREFDLMGLQNAKDRIKRAPPYLVDKIAGMATGSTITISGVEIPVETAVRLLNT